jgi:hypothetical protein
VKKWFLPLLAALLVASLPFAYAATITPESTPTGVQGTGYRKVLAKGSGVATVVSSNILSADVTPTPLAGKFEVEVAVLTGCTLYYTVDNGPTTYTIALNGGTALTAGVAYNFAFVVNPSYTYNFQVSNGTTLATFVLSETSGASVSRAGPAGVGGGSGSGSVSWPLTATGDLDMGSNDITNTTSITGPTNITVQAAAGNNSVLIKPTGSGTATFYKGITFDEDVTGAALATSDASQTVVLNNNLTLSPDTISGTDLQIDSSGGLTLTASTGNSGITLTPSGTGVVAVTGAITATAGLVQTRAYACVLRIGADQTIANGADRTVDLSDATADFDAGSMLTVASDRITIPAALNGKAVLVTVGHCWQLDNGGTYRYAYAEHFNVSDVSQGRVQTTSPVVNNAEGSASRWVKVSTGDYFVMKVRTGGTGNDILYGTTAPGRTYFSVVH